MVGYKQICTQQYLSCRCLRNYDTMCAKKLKPSMLKKININGDFRNYGALKIEVLVPEATAFHEGENCFTVL